MYDTYDVQSEMPCSHFRTKDEVLVSQVTFFKAA